LRVQFIQINTTKMKFIASSSFLLKQLQSLGNVVNNNNTLSILDNFLFELKQNQLTITASDLETTMSATLEIESESKGSVAISARLLLDMLKTFSEQPLTFTIQEESSTVEISSSSGKYTLAYSKAEEFPKVSTLENTFKTVIPAEVLATAVSKTIFATGNDDLRPIMSGIFFHLTPEGLTFVATDAHRLAKYSRTDFKSEQTAKFTVPKKPLNILKNILATSESEVTVEYNESNAVFSFDNHVLICRLIDGKYPNYEAVIPKENPNKLLINRVSILNSVRRVSIFSNKTTHQTRMKMAGKELNISAEDLDYSNRATERLTCDYQGDDLEIGFNSRFLSEMLNNLDSEEISIEMSFPNSAGVLKPVDGLTEGETITMLVMPVKIKPD